MIAEIFINLRDIIGWSILALCGIAFLIILLVDWIKRKLRK